MLYPITVEILGDLAQPLQPEAHLKFTSNSASHDAGKMSSGASRDMLYLIHKGASRGWP
jgi:hypothetical protein